MKKRMNRNKGYLSGMDALEKMDDYPGHTIPNHHLAIIMDVLQKSVFKLLYLLHG